MKLALNTYVYEVAKWPIEKTLASAKRMGFKYTEYAACGSGDPTKMTAEEAPGSHQDAPGLRAAQLADAAGRGRAHGLPGRQGAPGNTRLHEALQRVPTGDGRPAGAGLLGLRRAPGRHAARGGVAQLHRLHPQSWPSGD